MGRIMSCIFSFVFLSVVNQATAHPGIGLVMDSKGNMFYTDLKQIWKQTPTGKKIIAVANVHSHELYLDKNDNMFGEHLWYEQVTEKFYHYQWCLKTTGQLIRLTENIEAFTQTPEFSFVRDDNGNMYWYENKGDSIHFIRRDTTGNKIRVASAIFRDIRWMFSTSGGEIYFLDLDNLYKITSDNKFQLVASNLCTGTLWTLFFGKQHSVFGVWFDKAGNTYTAVTEDRCVKKIRPDGEVTIVYKSEKSAPINGLFDKSGNLWVLEHDGLKRAKLTKVSIGQLWFSNNSKYLFGLIGLLVVSVFTTQIIKRLRNDSDGRNKKPDR